MKWFSLLFVALSTAGATPASRVWLVRVFFSSAYSAYRLISVTDAHEEAAFGFIDFSTLVFYQFPV